MKYYSTRDKAISSNFENAIFQGLAPDGGLFMPEYFPQMSGEFIQNLGNLSFQEIALEVVAPFVGDEIGREDLKKLIDEALHFPIPLVRLSEKMYVLELFHGPTGAFKDVGARLMAQLYGYFLQKQNRRMTILVATSGDTGGAVASAFYKVPNVDVCVLYPTGKVSDIQEKQMTGLGHNIHAFELDGVFDDCQFLVKKAFSDEALKSLNLTTANSINVARLIPQSIYYFHAWGQLNADAKDKVVFSVPSGNLGNVCAGIFARKMGLPVHKFIASSNINDVFPQYLKSGVFTPRPSVQTYSNAMDIGNPSNYERLMDIYSQDLSLIGQDMEGFSCDDKQTLEAMQNALDKYKYLLDPHTAIAYLAMENYLEQHQNSKGMVVSTAHPAKFLDVMEKVVDRADVEIPENIRAGLRGEKQTIKTSKDYESFARLLKKTLTD